MFFVHTTLDEFKTRNNHWSFGICDDGKLAQGNHVSTSFTKKRRFQNIQFRLHVSRDVFNFVLFEGRFRKSSVFLTD